MTWNGLDAEPIMRLADAMVVNRSLATMDLSYNRINDVAGVLLGVLLRILSRLTEPAYGLRRNPVIRSLRLDGNPLGRNGAQACHGCRAALIVNHPSRRFSDTSD